MGNVTTVIKHRSSFELHAASDSDAFGAAADLVVSWLMEKEANWQGSPVARDVERYGANPLLWDYSQPGDYAGGPFDDDAYPALATASHASDQYDGPDAWAVEYDEPDAAHVDRRWHTTVSLELLDGDACRVSTEVACRIRKPRIPVEGLEQIPVAASVPALVRNVVSLEGYEARVGNAAVLTAPQRLDLESFAAFAAALTDPERTMPMALFCTGFDGKTPEYATQLARRALATCNVYVLDWSSDELREALFGLFAKGTPAAQYTCLRASARIYPPHVDLTDIQGSPKCAHYAKERLDGMRPSEFADAVAKELASATRPYRVRDLLS